MSAAIVIPTRRGIWTWLVRRWKYVNVCATLHWAEHDLALYESKEEAANALPGVIEQQRKDVQALRVDKVALQPPINPRRRKQ